MNENLSAGQFGERYGTSFPAQHPISAMTWARKGGSYPTRAAGPAGFDESVSDRETAQSRIQNQSRPVPWSSIRLVDDPNPN